MGSVTVSVEGSDVVVRTAGPDRLFALRRELRVPLAAVASVDVGRAPLPRGLRLPGTAWPFRPGRVVAGTFRSRRGREFHVVHGGHRVLIVELSDPVAPWRRLVLEVPDPDGAAHLLRSST